jgi:organic radical activating enzyme
VTSDFKAAAEEMQARLGPALCLAKWQQVSLHLGTGMTNSCYHPPLHKIPVELLADNPSALHNTPHKKQQRVFMLKNERPKECSYCWSAENNQQLSDRHYRSGEPWAAEYYDKIVNSTGEEDVVPSYVEVNFSNVCNLKCSYCSPQFSSQWAAEVNVHGAYPTSNRHNDPEYFTGTRRNIRHREDNPYVDAFWAWWPELYPRLQHLRLTGGEPLLDYNTYRVFEYVLALPKPDLHLDVTSNFSVDYKTFDKYIDYVQRLCKTQIEHFMQYVSLDTGVPHQAEYIRSGLNWHTLTRNVDRYLTDVPEKNSLTFIVTINNLSIVGLQDLLDYILELRSKHSHTYQRVWFDTPLLRQPAWQSIQTLTPAYQLKMEQVIDFMRENESNDSFVGFRDYEIQRMERNLVWMKEPQTPERLARDRADFYRFFNEHDRRRETDFLTTFPEMREFWSMCKYYAETE